jgi:hypothetical protein
MKSNTEIDEYSKRMILAAKSIAKFNTDNGRLGDVKIAEKETFKTLRQMYITDKKSLNQVLAMSEEN